MEVSTSVAEDAALFGLGETVSSGGLELRRDGRAVGLWNRDSSSLHPDHNTYGSRPFFLAIQPGAAPPVNSGPVHTETLNHPVALRERP